MSAPHLEAARPTTPGTETGSPATDVRTPGPAPARRGEAYAVGRVDEVPPGEGRAFVAGGVPVRVYLVHESAGEIVVQV